MNRRPPSRTAFVLVPALLLIAACGGAAPSAPAPSGAGPASTAATAPTSDALAGVDIPADDEQTVALAAADELAFVDGLREQAGIGDLVGPLADDAFAAIAEAQTTTGETRLPEIAEALGIELASARVHLAAAGPSAPGANRPPPNEWTGSMTGHATYTITMMTGMLSGAIGRADVDQPRSTQSVEDHYDSTNGGVHEVVDIKTTYTLQTGGGQMFGEIKLETIAVGSDAATGKSIGTILGTATGSIDVNACPDETGLAEGRLTLALSEGITSDVGGAGSSHAVDAPMRLIDGDDAHLSRTDLDASVEAAAHGPGTSGGNPGGPFDWEMSGVVPLQLDADGGITVDRDGFTTTGRNATDANVAGAVNHAIVGSASIAREIGREAERFWRSGKCIDLKASEQSRAVDPDETLAIDVEPVHRFDGQPVKAPVTAALQGTRSVEPANTPVDPPASFDFVAGHSPGEKGTVTLTQTGRRGIGKASLDFEVRSSELLVSIRSEASFSPAPGIESAGVITIEATLKADASGVFRGDGTWSLTGTFSYSAEAAVHESGCTGGLTGTGPVTLTATPDEADQTAITLTGKPVFNKAVGECAGQGAGDPSIFAGVLNRAFADSLKSVRLTIDGPGKSTTGKENVGRAKTVTTISRAKGASPGG